MVDAFVVVRESDKGRGIPAWGNDYVGRVVVSFKPIRMSNPIWRSRVSVGKSLICTLGWPLGLGLGVWITNSASSTIRDPGGR